jgi:2-C-methyl-D-erythritol 2,4-cyclodiphosphate synthase
MSSARIGHGFDLHRLEPGLPLILGGVTLEHDRGCAGHSDGDAVYHCAVDAVLGALSLPDIGQLFPDTDPRFKGAASHVFMTAAYERMTELGYGIGNIDVTIILERPKLSPHKARIRQNIADLLCTDVSNVNVKAKTHESVDALGENRAVSVHAVALLRSLSEISDVSILAAKSAVVDAAVTGASVTNQLLENVAGRASSVLRTTSPPSGTVLRSSSAGSETLENLYATVLSRKGADPSSSWTAKLFSKGRAKIAQKVGEEAVEVVIGATAGGAGSKVGVVKESADLLYHLNVLWADMGIEPREVWNELAAREGVSGILEKSSRPKA